MTVDEFLEKWSPIGTFAGMSVKVKNQDMKADLEEMIKGPDSLWKREYESHCANLEAERERLERAKRYAKDHWDDNFMGTTQEQCDKGFEESWHREVVLIPSESILAKE